MADAKSFGDKMEKKMTDTEYEDKMDILTTAFHTLIILSNPVTDEDMGVMEQTIEVADSMAFVLVKPFELKEVEKKLEGQRKMMQFNRLARKLLGELDEHKSKD